jgi:hypothetical protein
MIEERNSRNSFFDTEIKEYTHGSVPEEGALMFSHGTLFYGNGTEFKPVANANYVPYSGYQILYDGVYLSETFPQDLSVGAQKIVNSASTNVGNMNDYNAEAEVFYFRQDVIYNVTINFNAKASSITTHAQIYFGFLNNGVIYNQNAVLLNFAFQTNVAHAYSATFQIVGNHDTAFNGISLFINPSASAKLWNAKYTIQRFGYNTENQ